MPNTQFLKSHIWGMEQLLFDGVEFKVMNTGPEGSRLVSVVYDIC